MNFTPSSQIRARSLAALSRITHGSLTLTTPEGETLLFKGKATGPEAVLVFHDWDMPRRLLQRGTIAMGEDYIAQVWDTDNVETLIAFFLANFHEFESYAYGNLFNRFAFFLYNCVVRRNNKQGSRQNIEAHYDVGNDFYRLWLDEGMTYSSALFAGSPRSLLDAQKAKYERIIERIGAPGSVLEIGCGWGGFAEEAAKAKHDVTGITISPAQFSYATKRLGGKADIKLKDYRDVQGTFDSIVSIEMFEAVGERYWPAFFATLKEKMKKGGNAVIQTITVPEIYFDGYRRRSDFIRHYVFPGGMLPSLQRFREEAAKAGLYCRDVFSFGQDYASTLREWLTRFEARRPDILALGHNEQFIRNWRFYLGLCAATFAERHADVVQVELVHA